MTRYVSLLDPSTGLPLVLKTTSPEEAAVGLVTRNLPYKKPGYVLTLSGLSATSSTDVFAIESGGTRKIRLHSIMLLHPGVQAVAGLRTLQLLRTTTAGTGGVVTPVKLDTTDPEFSGVVRSNPSVQGVAGAVLLNLPVFVPTSLADFTPVIVGFDTPARPPTVTVGAGQGIALRDPGALGASSLSLSVFFTEDD